MATKVKSSSSTFRAKPRRKRPGVGAKTRQSSHKKGKHYQKKYVGQGR